MTDITQVLLQAETNASGDETGNITDINGQKTTPILLYQVL